MDKERGYMPSTLSLYSACRWQLKAIIPLFFTIFCATLSATANAALPDLTLRVKVPKEIQAGPTFEVKVSVANRGKAAARGTSSNASGYMVDLFLTRGKIPQGFARYSQSYFDGVLLKGGRIDRTADLAESNRHGYQTEVSTPTDTPPGNYKICARVDPAGRVRETNKKNNLSCLNIKVIKKIGRQTFAGKDLKMVSKEPPLRAHNGSRGTMADPTKRTVLPDGTLEILLPDGIRQRRAPNGQITTILPDGTHMTSKAIQVPMDELPALPSDLSDWGQKASDALLQIIQNLLTEAEFNAYQQTEINKPFYPRMEWCIRSIDFLTRVK
jgi:hypothetical protein